MKKKAFPFIADGPLFLFDSTAETLVTCTNRNDLFLKGQ